MSIHYKFKSALDYSTLSFCGDSISIADLKREIIREKQLTTCDIQITNADTKQVYCNESSFLPAETSVIITRTPLSNTAKSSSSSSLATNSSSGVTKVETTTISPEYNYTNPICSSTPIASSTNITIANYNNNINCSSAQNQYRRPVPSNYCCKKCQVPGHWIHDCPYYPKQSQSESKLGVKSHQEVEIGSGDKIKRRVPQNYVCNRCKCSGHWIQDCVLPILDPKIKRCSGIPRSFMVPAVTTSIPGALVTPEGQIVIPAVNQEAYKGKNFRHEHHQISGQYNQLNHNNKIPRIE